MRKLSILPLLFFAILNLIFINELFSDTAKLPFQIGEQLTFTGKFNLVAGGKLIMSINEDDTVSGYECYHIKSTTKTNSFFDIIYKVRDEIDSYWDGEKLVSRKFVKKISEGRYKEFSIHYYYPEDTLTHYTKYRKGKTTRKEFKILPKTQDALSIFYYVRLQEFNIGDSFFVNVTTDGENFRIKVVVEQKDILNTIFGKKECFKLVPISIGKEIKKQTGESPIWLTADKYKIPIRIVTETKYGKFTFELRDAKNVNLKIKK